MVRAQSPVRFPPAPQTHGAKERLRVVGSVLAYCSCSMTMMYSNKAVLSSYNFRFPWTLLTAQCAVAVVLLWILNLSGYVKVEPLDWATCRKWYPATVLFCMMLFTGTQSLMYLSIPIVTVFKNLTNIVVAYGDKYFYGQEVTQGVLVSLMLMVLGSLMSGWTDLQFDLIGYLWMFANCFSTGANALYIRKAKKDTSLGQWGMSYYNNCLTITLVLPMALLSGELSRVQDFPYLYDSAFQTSVFITGAVGTALSLATFWCVSETSATTYSMIGSLNKIPLTVISFVFFDIPINFQSAISITFGLLSGMVFTYAKYLEQVEKEKNRLPA
eukprot:comp58129_c0_seq1/m.47818 comp58129_c0_seq1/g.47818  ORF comp58129_c0_seq1/g.47818 comp58129_c0_seq1/m.47818 type:complete len:328 (-) comp58129_c0_seq1:283-1266(-)